MDAIDDAGRVPGVPVRRRRGYRVRTYAAPGRETPVFRPHRRRHPGGREIGLRYHFPAYTMLPPETLEREPGDIAALRGTRVEVLIEPTIEIPGGTICSTR